MAKKFNLFKKTEKLNIYLDADDTILKSSEAVIKILNSRYGLNKTYEDMTDWEYKSIYPKMTNKMVEEIYSSDEFFDIVEFDEKFIKFYENNKKHCNFYIVTKGDEDNLSRKEKKIRELMGDDVKFYGLISNGNYDKSGIDMKNGIQVDDRTDCLTSSNAVIKILLTHSKELPWNETPINEENFYVMPGWEEAGETLEFIYKN